jgi:hypothetical protein
MGKRKSQRHLTWRRCPGCRRSLQTAAFYRDDFSLCRKCREAAPPTTVVTVRLFRDRVLRVARVEDQITLVEGFSVRRAVTAAVSPLPSGRVRCPMKKRAELHRAIDRVALT